VSSFVPAYCILCDDVRVEMGGKEILVGVYSVGVSVPSVPWIGVTCLRFTGYWSGDGELNFQVRVQNPAGKTVGESSGSGHPIWHGFQSSLTLRGVTISFDMEGIYEIQFFPSPEFSWHTVHKFPVFIARTS
jgi:hypothetical protein